MRLLTMLLASGLAATVCATAPAQRAHRTQGVTINCECRDAVGAAYVAALRNNLHNDGSFEEMTLRDGAQHGAIVVNIISMPVDSKDGAPHAVLSIVYSREGTLVHQFIETCPHLTVEECAMNVVRDLKQI